MGEQRAIANRPAPRLRQDRRIRDLRPPKPAIDPWTPLGVSCELERAVDGRLRSTATLFLAGSECPFTCVHCDLWRFTIDADTPAGAIPSQLERGLARLAALPEVLKLYNASNFFEPRAVPDSDSGAILERLEPYPQVTVECHPRLVGRRAFAFADSLAGRLEVAMGLETAHPEVLARLNKRMTVDDFTAAAGRLRERGIGVRAFVLLGVPFLARAEQVDWTVRSVEVAALAGAEVIALVPLRGGNGELDRLERRGDFEPPDLELVEACFDAVLERVTGVAVQVDPWDLERLIDCAVCGPRRLERLKRMNLSGRRQPPVGC